jgi:hypothetical protein
MKYLACLLVLWCSAVAAQRVTFVCHPDAEGLPQCHSQSVSEHRIDWRELALAGASLGAGLADVHETQMCIKAGTCHEANSLMPSSAGGQYAMLGATWSASVVISHILKKRGHRIWVELPLVGIGMHTIGAIDGARNR